MRGNVVADNCGIDLMVQAAITCPEWRGISLVPELLARRPSMSPTR